MSIRTLKAADWEKMFANHIFGKGFVSKKKYKEFIKLDNKKTKNSIKHRQMI